jgi:hypothetical protein
MKDLHEEAGLVKAGMNTEGEMEWIGTDKMWRMYEIMEAGEHDCHLVGGPDGHCNHPSHVGESNE